MRILVDNCEFAQIGWGIATDVLPEEGYQIKVERECTYNPLRPVIFTVVNRLGVVRAVCGATCGQPNACEENTTGVIRTQVSYPK